MTPVPTHADTVAVFLRLPETKGYEVSEIENILEVVEWVRFSRSRPCVESSHCATSREHD